MRLSHWITAGAALTLCFGSPAMGDLTNGGFETGLAGWTTTGHVVATDFELSRDFLPPIAPNWLPTEGAAFASLWSTDNAGAMTASLSQTFTATAGLFLSFDYFFDYGDMAPYLDTAVATLIGPGRVSQTLFEYNTAGHELADDENVGWASFVIGLPETGDYTLMFSVTDADGSFESILGVDNAQLIPAPGAVVLGMIGLGLIGWFKRRLA